MINAIAPIFCLILIGYAIKRTNCLKQSFWDDAEKITYYVFFPALLVSKVAVADLSTIDVKPLALTLYSAFFIASLLTFITQHFLKLPKPSFTSVYQGSIRFNTYIGLALASSLFGEQGLIIAVMVATLLIPVINLFVVLILQIYSDNQRNNRLSLFIKQLLSNPLILGCLIGLFINLSHIKLPIAIFNTINILGTTALPIGLLSVGAALTLTFMDTHHSQLSIIACSVIKLIIYPLTALLIATHMDLDTQTKQITVIFCALPTASAAYIMAKNMGGDSQLMARIITLQTLFSLLTLIYVIKLIS